MNTQAIEPGKERKLLTAETIGKRIARLRSEIGWTQQTLASRLAISRVAISHMEMDLSVPSERTVILLAGIFKQSPHDLVEGTTYPQAKAERLPSVACCYTEMELEIDRMQNDLRWLKAITRGKKDDPMRRAVVEKWRSRLAIFSEDAIDENERRLLTEARQMLTSFD